MILDGKKDGFCSDNCKTEHAEKLKDSEYFLQDWLVVAREMGISKQELFEDYYMDEFIILTKRRKKIFDQKEDSSEVYADEFFK